MFRAQRIDPYLPKMFGSVHRRFRKPRIAIGFYGLAGIVVELLSQAGTSVHGAYDVLVSMSIMLVGAGVAVFAIAQRKKARALALIRP